MAVHAAQRQQMADIAADPTKPRWARVPRGRVTCAFCTMLAGRGFVYTSEEAAGGGLGNTYHNHCDCEPVPTWGEAKLAGYDQTRYEGMYRSACKALGDGASSQSICGWIRDHFPVSDATVTEMHSRGVSSVDGCVNWEQRANYMRETWGVIMDKGIGVLPEECQKAIVGGIDDAFAFRPVMKGAVSRVKLAHPDGETFFDTTYADADLAGVIRVNDVLYSDYRRLNGSYASDVAQGFHVHGTTCRALCAHETAHAMEWKALRDADKDMKARDVIAKWASDSGHEFGSETLRLLAGNGIDDIAGIGPLISGYAATNGHELVAEAFVDVLYNGDNASPLSVAVVREKIDRRAVDG